jgi:hypothetical protein
VLLHYQPPHGPDPAAYITLSRPSPNTAPSADEALEEFERHTVLGFEARSREARA